MRTRPSPIINCAHRTCLTHKLKPSVNGFSFLLNRTDPYRYALDREIAEHSDPTTTEWPMFIYIMNSKLAKWGKMAIKKNYRNQILFLEFVWELGKRVWPQATLPTLIQFELIQKQKRINLQTLAYASNCRQRTCHNLGVHIAKCQCKKTASTTASMEREPTHMWKNSRFWKI